MPLQPVPTGRAFMAMEQPEGSNSNTYRPVFALLQTLLRLSFFLSLSLVVRFEEKLTMCLQLQKEKLTSLPLLSSEDVLH